MKEIDIQVKPNYHDRIMDNGRYYHAFNYEVEIKNRGVETIQVLARKWIIVDSLGPERRVKGEGVVGKQPVISASETFSYKSWSPLIGQFGFMSGEYLIHFQSSDEHIWVEIPRFELSVPGFWN